MAGYHFAYPSFESETGPELAIGIKDFGQVEIARFAGCVMFALMPGEGLSEAVDTIKSIFNNYSFTPGKPQIPAISTKIGRAKVVAHQERENMAV
ncbi:hypothetical protein [Dehalogenimonas alkenigignens]|uniref:hypothetical protein n=1 Tax=Dehalogenimonas alkenigignens TaxID=1217799 RepID=UPI000D569D1C|nr:hypothetical protein [Dehalogenimonas alkenigignens]PVV83534.1 hypothetical protein DD509_06805 [Dehalogenimonas alkenigignens]